MALIIEPEVYFHAHVLNTSPTLEFNLLIQQVGSWSLFNDPSMIFTIQGETKSEHNGAGNVFVEIGMNNSVNELEEGFYQKTLTIISGSETKTVTINLIVAMVSTDFVFPTEMVFESVRNIEEAEPQTIYVTSQDDFESVELPSFLELVVPQPLAFDSGRAIMVKPKYFFDTPEAYYSGEIKLNFENSTKIISVEYFIRSGFDQNYLKPVHFTRDNDELVFYKTINDKTFLRLTTNIKVFGYSGDTLNNFDLQLDLPFINNCAKINMGIELEPYFKIFNSVLGMNNKVNSFYPPMEVSITAQELKYSDFTLVNQDILPTQRYLKGRNPVTGINSAFWLAFRPNKLRFVSPTGRIFLQIFKPASAAIKNVNVYLNDEFHHAITPGNNGFNLYLPYFLFVSIPINSIPGIKTGDKLSFEYEGMHEKRHFVVDIPKPYSFLIAFETNWATMDLIEFTGPASFSVDYSHSTSETMRNFVEVLNKIQTLDEQKVTINTGWIYKSETFLIDELIKSKKAFLVASTSGLISFSRYKSESENHLEIEPVSTKMVNHESDRNLKSFDIEFKINKRYADEIYSR